MIRNIVWIYTLMGMLACVRDTGVYQTDAGVFDAGMIDRIDERLIGTSCEAPWASEVIPHSSCPLGMQCVISSLDGLLNSGFAYPLWEDQMTLYTSENASQGYCTLVGTWSQPPVCPSGTVLKLFSPNSAVCLKTCDDDNDCVGGRVCDRRYIDLDPRMEIATCVAPCEVDYPSCIRTGVFRSPRNQLKTHVAMQDLLGGSQCAADGHCVIQEAFGTQPRNESCTQTSECSQGLICLQKELLSAVMQQEASVGFCAQPCHVAQPETCGPNSLCQPALGLGFSPLQGAQNDDQGLLILNLQATSSSEAFGEAGGFCFSKCQDASECSLQEGTSCKQLPAAFTAPDAPSNSTVCTTL